MAVLLVLASGTAVSLAVTDGGSSAVGSNAAVQETTDVGEQTTVAGNQETTEVVGEETTEAADDAAAGATNVTIDDQESDGERIVIEEVTLEEGGFVAIHDETLLDGDAIGSVVGTSVYLEAGTHENVVVTLGRPINETQTLIAMPHQDTNDNQVYDFVISGGEVDGAYTTADGAVTDQATVTVGEAQAETTEEVEETATEDVEETTEAEGAETTEVDDVETTEEVGDVVTTEEVGDVETTEEVGDVETTEEEVVEETTTEAETEAPAGQQQLIFKIEQMNIDRWSFVLGDEETPDRTETVSNINVQDRRVEINLTEILRNQSEMPSERVTTQDPEQIQEQVEENLSGDIETVRFVIENVNIENVTFVITAPEDMELPETPGDVGPPMTTEEDDDVETTTEEDVVEETTTEEVEETTAEETDVIETTTEIDDVVETTTEAVDGVETTEVDDVETTATDDVETTTEEDVVEETTTEAVDGVETTTAEDGGLQSFEVTSLNAPESAQVGDTVNVSAVVENPNDAQATQEVEFRLEGTVVAREEVTLNATGSTTVEFQVDTTDVPPGEYIHGVYTRDFGELAVVTLNEPSTDGDGAAETTTAAAGDETEVPDEGEVTTVAIETTTADA